MNEEVVCICSNLFKSFKKRSILKGCNLNVKAGELVGLTGENGAGKSTLVRCLLGFTKPDGGSFKTDDSTGYCPQEDSLNNRLTVEEHFTLIETIYEKYFRIDKSYVRCLIERLKIQTHLNTLIEDLSSGTYQKVKFISSLYHRPRLLVLDEPYDGFDWQMYKEFWKIISELAASGSGILMISHFIYDYEKFNRIYEITNGSIEETKP